LPVYAAFESNDIVGRVPEVHPTEIPELRFAGGFEIELHIVIEQLQQKPYLLLTYAQGLAMRPLEPAG